MRKVKAGIIGCGIISPIYFEAGKKFDILDIVACADLDMDRARARAAEFGVPKACTADELLADPEIEIVINLTIPAAHAELHLRALEAGKHTYGEKPLAIRMEDGQRILELAKRKNLLVGSAPDTFLGGGIQTCRKLIDDGWIGKPVAATAFMMGSGPESWHANPGFLYQVGAGPMFDMGPYYLTALINLIGPVRRVAGSAQMTYPERTITNDIDYGKKIPVEVPTHIAGTLDFANGAVGTLITSVDIQGTQLPHMEIYGSTGTLVVPDPNTFGGPVLVKRHDQSAFAEIPLTHGFADNSRGLGIVDMAYAIVNGRPHRANGEMAYHALELMHGFHLSSEQGVYYEPKSTCERPAALPSDLPRNGLDG
ncbi:Gfo/Idh/MocA family protein [Cohnella sp. REN36]|uniref:Gfo/Idh/MocA family protein n=1 Tax=Cohnella sp. REN36 TaxID=2887347 RepID=UPI001D151C5A|nr:Gfo/Idh/MocA family oxidoreductase [Cohnella sp. REN36]MCC3375311.1 Gfo/Idh/MocA family oxidoreductase [Cohnella sp. REN36]